MSRDPTGGARAGRGAPGPVPAATGAASADGAGPAGDPQAPYVRLAVVGLIRRDCAENERGTSFLRDDASLPRSGMVPDRVGEWLLIRRREPPESWDPPGGRMEKGEDLTTAVVREVAEETGLTVRVDGPCYAFLTVYKGERLLAVSMACRPLGDPNHVLLEPDGATDWRWARIDEWRQLAVEGRSTWAVADLTKATRAAMALWGSEEE